jgi:4-carboxymuconolactone decarboxylase
MGQAVRFQETLRGLAMIDEGFVEDQAGLRLGPAAASALDPKTTALLQVAVSMAIGSPAVCLERSAGRALAAGASEDEIAGVLLAIAPVAGLCRVVCAAPTWGPPSGTTSRPRWRNQTITDSSAGHVNLPESGRRSIPRRLRTNSPSGGPGRAQRSYLKLHGQLARTGPHRTLTDAG